MKTVGEFRRIVAVALVAAMALTLWPAQAVLAAGSDVEEGPAPAFDPVAKPFTPGARAPQGGDIGILSTIPTYDPGLDDGYLSRWDGKPTLYLSPNGDGVQETVTLSWFEPFEGKPEVPEDPGDPEADPPIPPTEGEPAIPPGADTEVWVIAPPRTAKESEAQYLIMPEQRMGPGIVSFVWDGTTAGGMALGDNWYYWYTRRVDPETGEVTTSRLGRVLIDRSVTELRKVITREPSAGQLEMRIQGHDDRSGVKGIKVRVLSGGGPLYEAERTFQAPAWRWWPDQEFTHFTWPIANREADYTLEVTTTDFTGNQVKEEVPLWPPVNRTGAEPYWPLADGRVLGFEFTVNPASGNLSWSGSDLALPGFGLPLNLIRSYNHQLRRNGMLGWGFHSPYDERIEKDKVDNSLIYTDPDGSLHIFQRSGAGVINPPGLFYQLEVIPDPNGRDESYRITQKSGVVTEYNIHGRPVVKRDKNGNETTFAYLGVGFLEKVTDASGRTLLFTYESDGTLTKGDHRYAKLSQVEEILPTGDGRKVSFEYNEAGELSRAVDLAGVETRFDWDDRHRISDITVSRSGEPKTIHMEYDSQNALSLVRGDRGDKTELWQGDLTWRGSSPSGGSYALSDPLGTRTYAFNGQGNLESLSLPEGGTWTFSYQANLLRSKGDPLGNTTAYGYDSRGNLKSVAEPGARATLFDYTPAGDLQRVTDPMGRTTSFDYYPNRDLYRVIDGRGGITRYSYYDNGLLRQSEEPGGLVTDYGYDGYGNLTSRSDARSASSYTHDSYGNQLTSVTRDNGSSALSATSTIYDLRGNALTVEDAAGVVTTYHYDENGNRTLILVSGSTGSSETAYFYDASFNLKRILEPYTETRYQYDAAGNRTRMEVREPGGGLVSATAYAYYRDGSLKSETNPLGGTTTYTYDPAGRRKTETTPAGLTTYDYDERGNLTSLLGPERLQLGYGYDDANQKRRSTQYTTADDGSLVALDTFYTYDGAGDLETILYPDGHLVRYVYDQAGNRKEELDFGPEGAVQSLERVVEETTASAYDTAGVGLLAAAGEAADAKAEAEPVPLRRQVFEYDAYGQLKASTDGEGHTTTYGYDYLGNQNRVTDPTGVTTTYRYDGAGRLVEERSPAGLVRTYGYDHLGNTRFQSDASGIWRYDYDEQGRLKEAADPAGGRTRYTYDAAGNRRTAGQDMGDGRWATTTYFYDPAGNVRLLVDGENNRTSYEYDSLGRRRLERREGLNDAETVETAFYYDGLSRLLRTVDGKGNETVFEYNPLGQRVASYDPSAPDVPLSLRNRTSYQYDLAGNLQTTTDALGNTTHYEHDVLGNQAAVVDARGARTEYDVDRTGLVRHIRRFLNEKVAYTTSFDYDEAGRQLSVTDANGHTRRSVYDPYGRLEYSYDGLDNPTRYEYDILDRQRAVTDPLGHRTQFDYDALGRAVLVRNPLGEERGYRYDPAGNLRAVVEPLGGETTYTYNRNFRKSTVTDPRGLVDTYTYDGLGNKRSWTNGRDLTTTYEYDRRSNLAQVAEPSPSGGAPAVTLHDYDARDKHVFQQDPAGRIIEYQYDEVGRLKAEVSGGLSLIYGYDEAGNRTSVLDARGLTSYDYDLLGRVRQVEYPGGEVESFTYDGVGNVLTRTDGTGTTVYTYDPNDRVETVTDPTGTTIAYDYDAAGNKTGESIDGQQTVAEHDDAGRLTGYTDTLGFRYAYAYNSDDRLTSRSGPSFSTGYEYNEAGRPTRVATTAGSATLADAQYTYNERNFVSTVLEDGRSYEYRYDTRDQIVEVINPSGDLIRYTYDGAGNRLSREAVINGAKQDSGEMIGLEELIRLVLEQVKAQPGAGGGSGSDAPGASDGKGKAHSKETSLTQEEESLASAYLSSLGLQGRELKSARLLASADLAGTDVLTFLLADAGGNGKANPGKDKGSGGGSNGGGKDGAPGLDGKLTGGDNALLRGKGLKKGLLRKFQADEQGIVGNIVEILERIVNGETHVPPGTTAGLEKTVREVAAGYTIVGQEFEYNDLNQLVSAYDALRDETFNYAWDEAGALIQTGTADLSWDDRGRLSELVWADGDGIAFTYDAQGRRLSKTTFNHQGEGRQTTTFHYLAGTKMLLYEEGPGGFRLDYTYDSEGRRLTISHDGQTYWYIYNGHGDVVGLVDAQGSLAARYEYDDYGRIVHMWGADGSEVREGQGQIHYLNGDVTAGEVSPADSAATSGAAGDGTTAADDGAALDGTAPLEAEPAGVSVDGASGGRGKGLDKKASTDTEPLLADGSLTGNAGKKGAKGKDAAADAEETLTAQTLGEEIVKLNPYRYAGYRYDWETELYFLESRYYDSWANRFVSRDDYIGSFDQPLTLNRYAYGLNSAVNYTDPTGHVNQIGYDHVSFDTDWVYYPDPGTYASKGKIILMVYGVAAGGALVWFAVDGIVMVVSEWGGSIAEVASASGAAAQEIRDALNRVAADPNKVHHILDAKHLWIRVVANPESWEEVSSVIGRVMLSPKATEVVYKNGVLRSLTFGGETVQVHFQRLAGSTVRFVNAWVAK